MSIQPIGSALGSGTSMTLSTTTASLTHRHRLNVQHVGLAAAAQALGMSVDDLRSALLNGQSLATLASSKGVSTETLAVAIPGALMQADPTMSAARATALAQRMIEGKRTPPAPHGTDTVEQEHRGSAAMRAAFSAAAGALGLSRDQLRDALDSRRTLGSLAVDAGITTSDLQGTLATALTRADSTLTPAHAASIAAQLVQGPASVPGSDDDGDLD